MIYILLCHECISLKRFIRRQTSMDSVLDFVPNPLGSYFFGTCLLRVFTSEIAGQRTRRPDPLSAMLRSDQGTRRGEHKPLKAFDR